MQEIWKDIYFVEKGIVYDYRGIYQVSNLGRVKSLKIFKYSKKQKKTIEVFREKILIPETTRKGYLRVQLIKDKRERFLVHKLVAFMFIPNPDKLPLVNHINEIKNCNTVNNLEWCSNEYNCKYSRAKKVIQYDKQGNFIKEWESMNDAISEFNNFHICGCCKGKRKQQEDIYGNIRRQSSNRKKRSCNNRYSCK